MRISDKDKEILKLRHNLDSAYHIIRQLSDKKTGLLLGHIISRKSLNHNTHIISLGDFCYHYNLINSKDENLAKYAYFEIIMQKKNTINLKPISLEQIRKDD